MLAPEEIVTGPGWYSSAVKATAGGRANKGLNAVITPPTQGTKEILICNVQGVELWPTPIRLLTSM